MKILFEKFEKEALPEYHKGNYGGYGQQLLAWWGWILLPRVGNTLSGTTASNSYSRLILEIITRNPIMTRITWENIEPEDFLIIISIFETNKQNKF